MISCQTSPDRSRVDSHHAGWQFRPPVNNAQGVIIAGYYTPSTDKIIPGSVPPAVNGGYWSTAETVSAEKKTLVYLVKISTLLHMSGPTFSVMC